MTNGGEAILTLVFFFVSIVLLWQLRLNKLINRFADKVGATRGRLWRRIIVDGGIPLMLVLFSSATFFLYEVAVWPLLPNCQRGWWIYSLVARGGPKDIDIVGLFRLEHSSSGALVKEGQAYYVSGEVIEPRGDWDANVVWIGDGEILLKFHQFIDNRLPLPETDPGQYDGYFNMKPSSARPLTGRQAWAGKFQDVGDRHAGGPLYLERLGTLYWGGKDSVRGLLKKRCVELLGRAKEMIHTRLPYHMPS